MRIETSATGKTESSVRPLSVDSDELPDVEKNVSRRGFIGATGIASLLAAMGAGSDAALRGLFGRGLLPVAMADDQSTPPAVDGKPDISVLVEHPVSGEFAPHLLDDDVTPTARHYVRNNGGLSSIASSMNATDWSLTIDGEVDHALSLSLDDLKKMPSVTMPLVIECAGNGRAFFEPPVRGNPWTTGAVGCSEWTGVRLADLLKRAGLKKSAVYTAHFGDDPPLGQAEAFSRGVPIEKAMEPHTLVAYAMNGKPIPALHGFPVRLVVPGWIASCSQKWLNRIWIRDREHDSQKMKDYSYRVPKQPVAPGTRPKREDMVIATSLKVKSMVTRPAANANLRAGESVAVAGHAWAGDRVVTKVLVSADYGVSWQEAKLTPPANRYAWSRFEATMKLPNAGYYEIWARAFDEAGDAQPFRQPWNPKGYLGNVVHRVPVMVG